MQPAQGEHSNRLLHEKSPYLLQHAHNPVDWFPWGEEAFAKARAENKPIFLSIGYSTCHWCHVMEREEFEKPEVAAIMNKDFVNIKVDREERPDVDRVYMTFVQATTGGGGWPMSVWLTPELKPFVGGTYFPPDDRYGQPGFPKVLQRIADAWEKDHDKIVESGNQIVAALAKSNAPAAGGAAQPNEKVLQTAYEQLARSLDKVEGGFGGVPKFPRPVTLNFLFHYYQRAGANSDAGKNALAMNLFTLRKMADGGMHDQLGGGFHRYSVDALWHVPHFEKMLYDQGQLASAYLTAFQITRDATFESIARDTLDYVRRDMTSPEGGFYSAEDADSLPNEKSTEKVEGAFYVWTKDEIDEILGTSAAGLFDFRYGVEAGGNTPEGSDPHGELRGQNVLLARHSLAKTAKKFGLTEAEVRDSLGKSAAKLLEVRGRRPRPHLDDKIITAWNGLMISAYARGAQVLGDDAYLKTAIRAAEFVRQKLYRESEHTLLRSYRNGPADIPGFADDYAFYIQGLLDLYEASFDVQWLRLAEQLQTTQDRLFWDEKAGGYFTSTGLDASILLRLKEDNDNAEPAPSSVAALNLFRLAQMRDAKDLRERGEKTIAAFAPALQHFPTALPQMLVALDFSLTKPKQIVIAGEREGADTVALLAEARRHFLPDTIMLLADGAEGQKYLGEKLAEIREMKPVDGKAAAYVCENFTCKAPVTSPDDLRKLLTR
ncbi:MAG: thioredoxin domain-containing protein [Chthoniobacterales bacterium]|nr:thioredoxin domain-containing protein [Chthoniobacterales bacterium]